MKNIILIIFAFIIGGCFQTIQAQNYEISVDVTSHSCCPDEGWIDGDREYQGDGIGEAYTGPGNYTVYWTSSLVNMELTTASGYTVNGYCVLNPPGPSVQIYCYGESTHLAGNPTPSSLDFDVYLGVREYGEGGPPPGDD